MLHYEFKFPAKVYDSLLLETCAAAFLQDFFFLFQPQLLTDMPFNITTVFTILTDRNILGDSY